MASGISRAFLKDEKDEIIEVKMITKKPSEQTVKNQDEKVSKDKR